MDKNTITGFVLMLCVALAFPYISMIGSEEQPQQVEQVNNEQVATETVAPVESPTNEVSTAVDTTALFFASREQNMQEGVILYNDKVELVITYFISENAANKYSI